MYDSSTYPNWQQTEKEKLTEAIKAHFELHSTSLPTDKNYYTLEKILGRGAFGKVYLGTHNLTGQSVAMKMIKKTYLEKSEHAKRKVF